MPPIIRPNAFAIVGIGCRFPGGADSPDRFWRLLCDGVDAITEIPRDRFNIDDFFDKDPAKPGKIYTRWGGFIGSIDLFDSDFFGISPRETAKMDPQHRLLLEVAWEALEDSGRDTESLAGSRTGVFIGICSHDYGNILAHPENRHLIDSHVAIGNATSSAANRISHFFDFRGPSVAVDTACSSSLAAVDLACRSLADRTCDLAVAGGVNILLTPESTLGMAKAGMLSPDGKCKAFDSRANGYVRGEGAGVIILKPLAAALDDNDPIYAVIRGTAANQDGHTTGITVPSREAQEALFREVLDRAAIAPHAVQYVEAHGTGTPVGDPIEASAVGTVVSKDRRPENPCLIGSVKTNIGHLEAASGIAGLIKTALALKHGRIPPSLHFKDVNPAIDLERLRLRVATELQPWPVCDRAVAAVNSFGFGGSNAQVILEEPPRDQTSSFSKPASRDDRFHILTISARSEQALHQLAQNYRQLIGEPASASLSDLSYSASVRRSHHDHRLALVANTREDLVEHLDAFLAGESRVGIASGRSTKKSPPKLAFVFPGMGPQWWGMGRQLMNEERVFREVIEECDELLRPVAKWSLIDELMRDEANSRVADADLAPVTNFAIQAALTALLRSWGIHPDAVVGHSAGEKAAAYAAGAMNLSDALRVAFHRGRLQRRTAGMGKMLAVGLSFEAVTQAISGYERSVSVGAINSPISVALSGDADALQDLASAFDRQQVFCRFLPVDVPYHGKQMELIKDELLRCLSDLDPHPPAIPIVSATMGTWSNGQPFDADYWWQTIRKPVRFAAAVDQLIQDGYELFLEIGPHPVLAGSISECVAHRGKTATVLGTLRRGEDERQAVLRSLATLYSRGRQATWSAIYPQGNCTRLPTYPWQRERHWFEGNGEEAERGRAIRFAVGKPALHPLLGSRLRSVRPCWEADLGDPRLDYLAGHVVQGSVVFPAAAYVETALAAAQEIGKDDSVSVESISFRRALPLDQRDESTLQFVYDPADLSFQIHSAAKDAQPRWTLNAAGRLRRRESGTSRASDDMEGIRQRCANAIPVARAYEGLAALGLQYGGAFHAIEELWQGDHEALGRISLAASANLSEDPYQIHPALLDAAFQVLIAAAGPSNSGNAARAEGLFLPVSIDRVELHARAGRQLWSHAVVGSRGVSSIEGNIRLIDDGGNVVLSIRGLRCRRVEEARQSRLREIDDWLYQLRWESRPLPLSPGQQARAIRSPKEVAETMQAAKTRFAHEWEQVDYDYEVEKRLNGIASRFMASALVKLGWHSGDGLPSAVGPLAEALRIAPQQRRFFARLIDIVRADGTAQEGQAAGIPRLCDALRTEYPPCSVIVEMMIRCGNHLAEILRGQVDVRELLFSPEALSSWEQFFRQSCYSFYSLVAAEAIATAIEGIPQSAELRVLEVGAGTGATTSQVLPKLRPEATEYFFTDVSPFFLAQGRARFHDQAMLRFDPFDIEAEPAAQHFEPHSFDLVLAANVLHATANLRHTIRNLQRLIAPGGLLVLMELTHKLPYLDLLFGVIEGWWRFSDHDLRPSHPLMEPEQWLTLLGEAGFENPTSIDLKVEPVKPTQSVLLGQMPKTIQSGGETPRRDWLLCADRRGVAQTIADSLRQQGDRCTLAFSGEEYRERESNVFEIAPADRDHFSRVLDKIGDAGRAPSGIIHLWSLDSPPSHAMKTAELMDFQRIGCESVLSILQVYEGCGRAAPDLWLVTAGAQPLDEQTEELNVSQAPLWGLGRVLLNEQPNVRSRLVDLSAGCRPEEILSLLNELHGRDFEEEVAFREDRRFARRLRRTSLEAGARSREEQELSPEADSFRLEIISPGSLESLALREAPEAAPGPDEIVVRIMAAGLNFRDVMLALGMLPAEAFRGDAGQKLLGIECAGTVVACGEAVKEFRPGEEVVALATGTFGSRVKTRAQLVAHKPPHLTFEEAASIPGAFLTAHYGLNHLAKLTSGERVLIHAATGGVGLAAIQLARQAGAEIFATAGNPEKRAHLKSLGIDHVLDSRSLAFADEILNLTGGEGVDVVLNSLMGDAIAKGLSILRPYGRFVEIGKRDIYENSTVGLLVFNKNLSFFSVALDQLSFERPALAGNMLREILQGMSEGSLNPLPYTAFDLRDAEQAFRFMAQAKHIGKVVLSVREPHYAVRRREPGCVIRPDATYLIVGGLGGFGLAVADWMVRQGARHIVLMSRSGTPPKENQEALDALLSSQAHVVVARGDVSREEDLARVLDGMRGTMPPLKGIVHAALVLDDAPIGQLGHERMSAVLAPKVAGAWNLHTLTQGENLDFFVMFSSIASVLGSPAQGNYSSANAFLDALAPHRRALGLPALTINWGPLSGTGYVARHEAIGERIARQGLIAFAPEDALETMDQLLRCGFAQVIAHRQDWQKWSRIDQTMAMIKKSKRLSYFDQTTDADEAEEKEDGDPILQHLRTAAPEGRQELLEGHLLQRVAKVLGSSPQKIDRQKPLIEMGFDSLMAVELQVMLNRDLRIQVPMVKLVQGISLSQLAQTILEQLASSAPTSAPNEVQPGAVASAPKEPVTTAPATVVAPSPSLVEETESAPVPSGSADGQGPAETPVDGYPRPLDGYDDYYSSLDFSRWSRRQRLAQKIVIASLRLTARLDIEGLEHIPSSGPFILAGNHLSIIDAPLVAALLPRRTILIAGERWQKAPLVHRVLDFADAIYIRRGEGDLEALNRGLAVLRAGGALGIAPEGTISDRGLAEGHAGIAYLASEARVPVLPLVVYGQERMGANLKRFRRTCIHVRFGPLIHLEPGERTAARLLHDTRQVMSTLAAMLPPSYRGVYAP